MKRLLLVSALCVALASIATAQYLDAPALAAANPEAKLHLQKAHEARTANDYSKMLAEYKLALEIQPDALDIHRALLMDTANAVGMAQYELNSAKDKQRKAASAPDSKPDKTAPDIAALEERLKQRRAVHEQVKALYQEWMKQYPNKAIYPFLVARSMEWADVEKQEPLLQKALALDPKFVPALEYMSDVKGWLDEKDAAAEYMRKVVDLKPGDDKAQLLYAAKLRMSNPGAANKLLEEIVARNPNNATGIQAATSQISALEKPEEKVAAVERALQQFPLDKFKEMRSPIFVTLEAYAAVNPARGLELAQALKSQMGKQEDRYFQPRLDYFQSVVNGKSLLAAGKYAEAYSALEKVQTPEGMKTKPLALMKANAALGAGKSSVAYESLVRYFAETSDPEVGDTLAKCASAVGKSQEDVSKDVWTIRNKTAYTLKDLPLKRMENDQQFRLSDFKGKVVLLSFWHPG